MGYRVKRESRGGELGWSVSCAQCWHWQAIPEQVYYGLGSFECGDCGHRDCVNFSSIPHVYQAERQLPREQEAS